MGFAAFVGTVGTGKTMGMTHVAYKRYKEGYTVFANYHLAFPHVFLNTLDDLEKMKGSAEKPAIVCFDELWRWLDSRQYKKQKNDVVSKIIFYSRHRNIKHIYYTTQRLHQIEKRIRGLTDAVVIPDLSMYYKNKIPLKCTLEWHVLHHSEGSAYKVEPKISDSEAFATMPIMKLYNTMEEVEDLA